MVDTIVSTIRGAFMSAKSHDVKIFTENVPQNNVKYIFNKNGENRIEYGSLHFVE